MIEIRDIQGKVILSVPVLPESEHVEELMRTDEVHLFWNSDANTVLPDGAYVTVEGKRYSLIEPYSPAQRAENMWRYEPVFVSEFYALSKTPFFFYTYQGGNVNGTILSRETEWTLTDIPYNFMDVLCRAIFNETGKRYTFAIGSTRAASATITFSSTDIISALNAIANAFETEFWLDDSGCIHLSKAKDGASSKVLTVGKNVNVPSITEGGDGYYNQFIIFGSSRNITQDYQGANVNSIVTKRLTLDPSKYPGGYIDYSQGRTKYTKILTFDEIYPSATDLVITDVVPRFKYRLDTDTGERIQLPGGEEAVYDMYAVYYFKLKRKVGSDYVDFKFDDSTYNASDNPNGMMLPGLVPSIHFESGPLRGREFEIAYHKEAGKNNINDISEVGLFEWEADTFSIEWVTEGDLVIPSISGLVPEDDNRVILFNVKMPNEYVSDAQGRLEAAAFEVIGERYIQLGSNGRPVTDADGNYVKVDMNSYQMSSNPVAFSEANPGLSIGSSVVYVNGDYTLETRVTALVTKLDFPVKQTITIGNDRIVGTIRELQEQAANANQDLDLLASLNDATRKILEAYERTQQAIVKNMVDHYFEKDSSNSLRLNMKQEFAYLGVNSGLFFGRTNGTNPDLYIKTITEGGVAQRVLYSTLPIASESWISAKGANASGSSGESGGGGVGGSVYSRLDEWGQYNPDKADWVLSAGLGYDLFERLERIEQGGVGGGSVSSFRLIGEGNAITDVKSDEGNTELIFNRGMTFVTVDTDQTVTGFKTFTNGIKIGKATLSWDEGEEALKIDTGLYSMKWVSAKGAKSSGTSGEVGGGVSYDRLDSWEQYDKDKSDWVLSAGLGYDLYERLTQIESGGAGVSSFRFTGSGNAITSVSAGADGRELIFERGTSFVTLDTAQTITGEKTFQNLIKIGKATVSWDEKNQALKFDAPLYSEGFVSAGGLSDTGGSAAAIVNLWQLEDVSISNPKNGQVLAYADGKWVNTTIETGGAGLDESELAAYLTSKGYATQAWVTGLGYITSSALTGYVKKSGDTMTGDLTVNTNVTANDITISGNIFRMLSATNNYIKAQTAGGQIIFTTDGVSGTVANGTLVLTGKNGRPGTNAAGSWGQSSYRWSNIYSVLGNFSGQITSSVATGTAPLSVASTTLVSNLNADMIDGYHETSFMRYRGEVPLSYVDITDYTAGAEDFIKSLAPGIYNAPRPGAGEIVVNLAKNTGSTSALQFHTTYQASGALRFRKTVDNNRVSGAWTTILTNLNIGNYTAGSANTLATSRKLWGQSFNGSADVSGDLTGVGSITMTGSLKIGGATLTWDSTNNALKIDTGMYSTAFMSAGGLSNTGNTGGGDFDPSLLAGMLYLGEATTATTPYSGAYKCYYTATAAGTYSKFASGITVNAGEMVFIGKDGSGWRVLHRVNLGSATGGSVEWSAIANKPSWLTGTVGSNVKPIYMNAGELTASSYSFGNASGNIPVSNGTVNTNLNADMLDGVHASGLFSSLEMSGNNVSITVGGTTKTLNVTAVGNLSTQTMSKNDNSGYPTYLLIADVTTWYNTTSSPYAKDSGIVGIIVGWRTGNMSGTQVNRIIAWTSYSRTYYRLQTDATGFYLPKIVSYDGKYYLALKLTGSGRSFYFIGYKTNLLSSFIQLSCNSAGECAGLTEVFTESGIAMNGNATSATKLSTARTIWGQSFDGSANVSGAMTGVTTVNGVLTMPTSSSRIAELQAAANQTVGYRTVGSQYSMYFGIGSGNVNRGIYDTTNGGWMIYRGSSTNIYVPSGTFTIGTTTDYSGYSLVVSGNARITSGGLIVPYSQGTYLSMATRTTDITGNIAATASNAHSLYKVKTVSANVVAFGGLGDNVGFYGFYASRISAGTNGTDWSTVWNTNTGALTHNKAMTVSGAVTFSSTLAVSGAVTFSSTLSVTDSVSTPNINGGGGNLLIGNSGNKAFIQFQEDVKQISNNWHIDNDGTASFGSLTVDGDLEISGDMEIEGDLIPYRNNDYYIGSTSYRWANVYTQLLNVAGAATLGSTLSVGGNTTPSSNNSYTLGSSTYRWSNVYSVLGNFSGAVTMSSTLTVSGNTTVNGTLITKYLNGGGSDLTIGNSNNSGYVYFQEDLRQLNSKWQISNDGEAEFSTLSVSGTFTIGTPTSGSLKIGGATLSWDNANTALKVDKAYYSTDAISAGGLSTTSDARLKTILSDVRLTVEQIAAAPAKVFSWKKDGKPGAGSIAQYWQPLIPQAVHSRPDGFLGMEYGNIALVSAILIARKVNDHEERIKALERENAELKKEVERLKSAA